MLAAVTDRPFLFIYLFIILNKMFFSLHLSIKLLKVYMFLFYNNCHEWNEIIHIKSSAIKLPIMPFT